MIFRPIDQAELGRLEPLLVRDPASLLTAASFRARISAAEYRPARIWVDQAEHGGEPSARTGSAKPETDLPSAVPAAVATAAVPAAVATAAVPAGAAIWWGTGRDAWPAALDALYASTGDRIGIAAGRRLRACRCRVTGRRLVPSAPRGHAA